MEYEPLESLARVRERGRGKRRWLALQQHKYITSIVRSLVYFRQQQSICQPSPTYAVAWFTTTRAISMYVAAASEWSNILVSKALSISYKLDKLWIPWIPSSWRTRRKGTIQHWIRNRIYMHTNVDNLVTLPRYEGPSAFAALPTTMRLCYFSLCQI